MQNSYMIKLHVLRRPYLTHAFRDHFSLSLFKLKMPTVLFRWQTNLGNLAHSHIFYIRKLFMRQQDICINTRRGGRWEEEKDVFLHVLFNESGGGGEKMLN